MMLVRMQTRAERVLSAVRAEMDRQGVTTAVLAGGWGVPAHWAERRLSGKKGLTGSELGHIARALGVPAEQLLTPVAGYPRVPAAGRVPADAHRGGTLTGPGGEDRPAAGPGLTIPAPRGASR